jgi:hypothetical protein
MITSRRNVALQICMFWYNNDRRANFMSLTYSYLRRLQEAAAVAANATQQSNNDDGNSSAPPPPPRQSESPIQPKLSPSSAHSSIHTPFLNLSPSISSLPFTSSSAEEHHSPPIASSLSTAPFGNPRSSNDHLFFSAQSSTMSEDSQPYAPTPSAQPFVAPPAFGQALSMNAPITIPPLSYYCRPHRLEDIASRRTIMLVITLFFDFVYPLIPSVHRPSFLRDLDSRREEQDPMFFALVMSTVASTLVQVPRSYLPMERHVVRSLARRCFEAGRHISVASQDPPTSTLVVIRYL